MPGHWAATDCCMGLAGLKIPDEQDITLQALFRLGQYSGNIPLARCALCPAKCLRSACLECLTFIDGAKIKVAPSCLAWYTSIRHIAASIGQHSSCSKGPCMAAGLQQEAPQGCILQPSPAQPSLAQPSPAQLSQAQPSPACNFAWHSTRYAAKCSVTLTQHCIVYSPAHQLRDQHKARLQIASRIIWCTHRLDSTVGVLQASTAQYSTARHSIAQHSRAQAAQHSAAQSSWW